MSEKEYCVDIFTDRVMSWMEDYHPVKATSPYGTYYTVKANEKEKRKILRQAMWHNVRTRAYESRWARSDDYRRVFFAHTSPPYECLYCGRYIGSDQMQVDHIVPVSAVKKSAYARWLLERKGIRNVNDIRNLAPSCRRCNARKGTKLGLWYIRACLHKRSDWEKIKARIILWASIFFALAAVILILTI